MAEKQIIDTTKIGCTAEDLISHKLQRFELLVAKPKFDQLGADLLAFANIGGNGKFIRVQCKGRSVVNSASEIYIPIKYLADKLNGLLVTLFIEDGELDSIKLYCFFPEEIKKWNKAKRNEIDVFALPIPKDFEKKFKEFLFTPNKKDNIMALVENSDFDLEFKFFQENFQGEFENDKKVKGGENIIKKGREAGKVVTSKDQYVIVDQDSDKQGKWHRSRATDAKILDPDEL